MTRKKVSESTESVVTTAKPITAVLSSGTEEVPENKPRRREKKQNRKKQKKQNRQKT